MITGNTHLLPHLSKNSLRQAQTPVPKSESSLRQAQTPVLLSSSEQNPAKVPELVEGPPLHTNPEFNFGQYPPDYFDFIIIDECHRGGANDESNWRGIMEYFSPAFQLGLTATPKRDDNVNTYEYFGAPVYVYSLDSKSSKQHVLKDRDTDSTLR